MLKLKRVKTNKFDLHFKQEENGKWTRISRDSFNYRMNGNYIVTNTETNFRKGKCSNGSQDKTDTIYTLDFHYSIK